MKTRTAASWVVSKRRERPSGEGVRSAGTGVDTLVNEDSEHRTTSHHGRAAVSKRPVTARGEATRARLLDAAEQEFGARGFHNASIADITRAAGVGQGTFYLYFQSKEDVFRELVRHMGRKLRATISQAIEQTGPRMQAERVGLEAFLRFVAEHRNLYRVVQESLFVDEASYRAYYQEFADAYVAALDQAQRAGEIRPGHSEARAWAIMGLGHFLGLRYCLWDKKGLPPDLMEGVMDFIAHGMAPESGP